MVSSPYLLHRRKAFMGESELDPNIKILLNYEGSNGATSYSNETGSAESLTFGTGTTISTAQSKFGISSLQTTEINQYATIPVELNLAAFDFTIETWLYPPNISGLYLTIFRNSCLEFFTSSAGEWRTYMSTTTGFLNPFGFSNGNAFTVNAWNHIAYTRSGNTFRIFLNGTQIRSYTIDTTFVAGGSSTDVAGRWNSSNTTPVYFDGYQVNLGEALYTANFTVPTTPPP
jgi:hypothetical protein